MRFPKIRRVMFQWVVVGAGVLAVPLAGCGGGKEPLPRTEVPVVEKSPTRDPISSLPIAEPTPKTPGVSPDPVLAPPAPEPLVIPEGYAARMKYGKQLGADGRHEDAMLVFEKASEDEPAKAAPHIEIARTAITARKIAIARKHAEEAVELEPESTGAWNTLGRVELLDGDKLAAVEAFERATEESEDNAWAWNNLGLVLSQLGRWDEAVAALERATSGDKPEAYMWNNLAVAYEHTDQVELAKAAYRQAAKRGSDVAKAAIARLEAPVIKETAKGTGEVDPVDKLPELVPDP